MSITHPLSLMHQLIKSVIIDITVSKWKFICAFFDNLHLRLTLISRSLHLRFHRLHLNMTDPRLAWSSFTSLAKYSFSLILFLLISFRDILHKFSFVWCKRWSLIYAPSSAIFCNLVMHFIHFCTAPKINWPNIYQKEMPLRLKHDSYIAINNGDNTSNVNQC